MAQKKTAHKSIEINFLNSSDFESSPLGKVVNWILTIGKLAVFLTFLIVIIGFVYRFQLDKQVEALTDILKDNSAAVQQFAQTEPKMRDLQTKLDLVEKLLIDEVALAEILTLLETNLPRNTQLERLTVGSNNRLTFEGKAQNEVVFANLLGAFTQTEKFSQIIINNLQSGGVENPEISFSIIVNLKDSET